MIAAVKLREAQCFADGDSCPNESPPSLLRSASAPLRSHLVTQLLKVVAENLESVTEGFAIGLERLSFMQKSDYWKGLRSSSATSQKLLTNLFDACLGGSTDTANSDVFVGAAALVEQYMRDYRGCSKDNVASKLVQWQASLNLSTGFVTGFGGFMTMPITIPTGMLATWITSTRLAFAVAHVYGHDIFQPCVTNAVLYCLTGSASGDGNPEERMRAELQKCLLQQQQEDISDLYLEAWAPPATEAAPEAETAPSAAGADGTDPPPSEEKVMHMPSSKEFQAQYATLYDLLGVQNTATQQEIRVAYRKLALRYHPDKIQTDDPERVAAATQRFQMLAAAYEELSDPGRRAAYDAKLREGGWSWADFSWDLGVHYARNAYEAAAKRLTAALLADRHNLSGHMASRTATQLAVHSIEVSTVGAVIRSGGIAELRSSIIAGEKLAASATARSTSKLIPIIGAIISGAIDCATTASVGRCAVRVFKV